MWYWIVIAAIVAVLSLLLVTRISFYVCVLVDLQNLQGTVRIYLYNLIKVFDDDAQVEQGKLTLSGTINQTVSWQDIKNIKRYLYLTKSFTLRQIYAKVSVGNKTDSQAAISFLAATTALLNTIKCLADATSDLITEFDTVYTFDTNLTAVIESKITTNFLRVIANTINNFITKRFSNTANK